MEIFEYLALSYTWGIQQTYVTTINTIKDKLHALDTALLPKTIIEAITVTRRLGFRYLWVDSLCIIQDSKEDKRHEISQMRLIFQHATLTIAAGKASSVTEGLLTKPDLQWFMAPFKIPFRCSGSRDGTVSVGHTAYYERFKDPWNSRAWTLEEQILSPRVLLYSYDGLRWLCKTRRLEDLDSPDSLLLSLEPSFESAEDSETDNSAALRKRWCDILTEYSQRELTHAKDKLIAFAAIAEAFQRMWGGEYLAGVWTRSLLEDLLCHRDTTSESQSSLQLKPRPEKYRAPSRSWAAIDGHVFGPDDDDCERQAFQLHILECSVRLKSDMLPFGPVTGGHLRAEGILREVYRFRADSAVDFCDGFLHKAILPDSDGGPLPETSIDAVEPSLIDGASVFCLPLARVIDDPTRDLLEGLILLPVDEGNYRRVGFFSGCDDLDWFREQEPQFYTVV